MSCIKYGFTIQGDVNNELARSVDFVAEGDYAKTQVLASYFGTEEFAQYVEQDTGLKNYLDVNANTLRKLLRSFFVSRHNTINNSINKKNATALNGFSSEKAKAIAKDHTANKLIEVYYNELIKPKKERLDRSDLLHEVSKDINKMFNEKVVIPLIKQLKVENSNKKAIAMIDKVSDVNNNIKELNKQRAEIVKQYNESTDAAQKEILNTTIDGIANQMNILDAERYVMFKNIVDTYGNVREKNFSNLTSQIRGNANEWFKSVFNTSKLVNLVDEFNVTLENDKLIERNFADENDIVALDSDSVDEMAKSWEDSLYGSFDRHVSPKFKLYLNRLYNLATPNSNGSNDYNYDRNNELGVPTTMGANFIISQISNYASFGSVKDFINSINRVAQINPSLYGLSKLVNDMNANDELANEVFNQLANPKIAKTIITISENGIDIDRSNKSSDALTSLVYQLINSAKSTYKSTFSLQDREDIKAKLISLNQVKDVNVFRTGQKIQDIDDFIFNTLTKYFPKIDKNAIRNHLYSNTEDIVNIYKSFLQNISELMSNFEDMVDDYNSQWGEYLTQYKNWTAKKKIAEDFNEAFNTPMPIFDYNNISFDKISPTIVDIARKLVNYTSVKNELNSVNAEGNMASDLIGNSYLTNFMKQLEYGNTKEAYAGLERLKEFITKSSQYDYSSFYYGTKDSKGKVLSQGLFIKDNYGKVTVNPNARNLISLSLFDGAKDRVNSKATMYNGMSKGDYFLTQLIAFKNPIKDITKSQSGIVNAGYFMRTPSDAPKNFIVQMPKFDVGSLWRVINTSRDVYVDKLQNELAAKYSFTNEGEFLDSSEGIITGNIRGKINNNVMTADQIYDMFKNPINNKAYGNLYYEYNNDTNKVTIPIIYKEENTTMIVWLQGDKVIGTMNSIAENIEIKEVFNSNTSFQNNVLPASFLTDIADIIESDGIASGDIQRIVDRNNSTFRALQSQVLGEVNNFVNNLNNVFSNKNGVWTTKTKTDNLIDRAHYNGDGIVQDGKLTGNFFNFIRLFKTDNFDAGASIESDLFLYGQDNENGTDSLFSKAKGKLVLNTTRNDLIKINDGTISLNINENNLDKIDNIVENWLNDYYNEVINKTSQFDTIVGTQFSKNDIIDWAINSAITEMNFDDMFEGDTKFYKNAQDFLKRAKEVQAAGKAYAGFDINDAIGAPVHNTGTDIIVNGNVISQSKNGFKAVTIYNTVRPSQSAGEIKLELIDILTPELGKEEAVRVATEISAGYFDSTKVNDAQSYITLEEFISRRHADGTLNQYQGLLSQLMDDKVLVQDMDLKGINARIQVQKNFYFDKQFDSNTGTFYPRQIKNAEFVLIPKLIKGTDLETLYNIMKDNGIDQVNTAETSKAAKKNVLTFWDNNGVANAESFIKQVQAKNKIAVEDYYYQYLYKQQDVADHMVNEQNKAGIQIMKKLIDNTTPEVQADVDNFFEAYSANIKDNFNMLLTRMGWKQENGSLVDVSGKTNADGKVILNFEDFYKKARIEAQRLGMDSNFIEYLTPDVFGQPTMPNYMNNVSSKLESIAQSIFNNGVTRQTLPGWHAAQVTSVGHGVPVLGEDGVFRNLKYHPEVVDKDGNKTKEAYAEIMLPRWSSLIPKDYDLDKLGEEGLDIHLGYRIPTEGKQSVSILKVVAFLDEVYGSTIMVPDEWVTQTGSDFDVDSIYGINYEMYRDRKTGNLKKVKLDESNDQKDIERRYVAAIKDLLNAKIDKTIITDEFIKNEEQEVYNRLFANPERDANNKEYNKLMQEEQDLYKALDPAFKNIIKNLNRQMSGMPMDERYAAISKHFEVLAENETGKLKAQLEEFSIYNDAISYAVSKNKEFITPDINIKDAKKERRNEIYENVRIEHLNKVKKAAIEQNLMSYEDFAKQSIIEQNSRRARNNKILDSMINIMKANSSREENYSRSNFDDLVAAKEKLDKLRGAGDIVRSTYNPLDQIDFMENAISGATLKAFSVNRDTFNSVNNYTKTTLGEGHEITVEYDLNDYNINHINNAYDKVEIDKNKNIAIVTHNRIANSNNNRNVVGKLLTVYSSQTTAHILDAVKEGTIYNENDYTFGTFKTLIDVGIDYNTAIAFLMQPAVTAIVSANSRTKSIYTNATTKPIDAAIKDIANKLGITIKGRTIEPYTQLKSVISALSNNFELQNAYAELFNRQLDTRNPIDSIMPALNGKMLERRLNGVEISNNPTLTEDKKKYRDAAFDIAMIMNFSKYYKTTANIEAINRVSNPDRFGAKQTIRATRVVLQNALSYIQDPNDTIGNTLLIGGIRHTAAMYPGLGTNQGIDEKASAYPYIASFLKYATQPSVEANSQLFPTESNAYNSITDTVQARLGVRFTDAQYKEYKQYMMSDVYAGVHFLSTPLTLNNYGLVTLDNNAIIKQTEEDKQYWDAERNRIFGYDVAQSSNIEIKDINNPTEEEIDVYNTLTPAQKVMWVQGNFNEGRGIFEFLNTNIFNQYEVKNKGFSSQAITYNDQIDDIEEVYVAFKDSFYNKNPLIRLAAIDLVKYAFIAEGFKFKKGSISKIITNDVLYSNLEDKGLNIIEAVQQQFTRYTNPIEATTKKYIDKFVRSHSEIVREVSIPKPKKGKQGGEDISTKLNRQISGEGVIYIPFEEATKDLLEHLTLGENDVKGYIRITKNTTNNIRKTTLYKVNNNNKGVYLTPLNLLERNEVSDVSINRKNNIHKMPEYYNALIEMSEDNGTTINELLKDETKVVELANIKANFTIPVFKPKTIVETIENPNELIRLSNSGKPVQQAEIAKIFSDVNDHYSLPVEEQGNYLVIRNDNAFISSIIPYGTSIVQNIPIGDEIVTVKISKHNTKNGLSKQFGYVLKNDKRADITQVKTEELKALKNSQNAKSVNPNLYKIERVTSEQEREDYEALIAQMAEDANQQMSAITNIIEDVDVDVVFNYDKTDKVAKDIFNELRKRAVSNEDKRAKKFKSKMDSSGIDVTDSNSIHDNKKNIYVAAATYFSQKSHELLSRIDTFTGSNNEEYSIDDPKLYKHLTEYPEDYPLLVTLILDAKTFGSELYDIMNLNIIGEDDQTTKAIEKIRDSINDVRRSSKLKNATDLLFNDYIANNFSTNHLIRQGLIELKTTFGDTDWFDLSFSDVGELNHKQIQTVTKYVYTILNEANTVIAPRSITTFNKQYDNIIKSDGDFNMNNIVTKEGKFITPYTNKFLEDRERIINAVRDAKDAKGINSIEYIKAKLERDKWRAKNIQGEMVKEYYDANNELISNVLKNAPNEYVKYMTLVHELYADSTPVYSLTAEQKEKRQRIIRDIYQLTSEVREDDELKSEEATFKAKRLKAYIDGKKILNYEYFNYDESDGFRETLSYYNNIIKQYEKVHPNETLDLRLNNPNYREAYDWIKTNSYYTLDKDTQKVINEAFETLKVKDNNKSSFVKKILNDANAFDEYGNIDPRKLNADQLALIKKTTEHKFSWTYESNAGEAILIKDVPAGLPVLKDSFYRMLRGEGENASDVNPRRLAIIGDINKMIGRVIDGNTGQINSKELFDKFTEDELKELGGLYTQLHNIKGNRDKDFAKKFKDNVDFLTHDEAFDRNWTYAQTNLNARQYDIWLDIFIQKDKNGVFVTNENGKFVPNNDIFGYVLPKDKTYIDEAKTDARNTIQNDIEYTPTEYYYDAQREASNNGTFNEWYTANHVFNPYSHKMEPLKIWTTMQVTPKGYLNGNYSYVPTYENTERTAKDEYLNPNHKQYSTNYNIDNGDYNNLSKLSSKENEMLTLLQSTINAHASTHSMRMFSEQGFLPRRARYEPDAKWYVGQAFGAMGLEFRNTGEQRWTDTIDYTKDFDADFDMMSLIKQKGYKERIKIESKGTQQDQNDYDKYVASVREDNKKIDADNLKLDNELLDNDWRSVFNDFIHKATEYNAKQRAKNTIYLLLEDLKSTQALKESAWGNNLKKDNNKSTNQQDEFQKIDQKNSHAIVENWARRVLFDQFKKGSPYSKYADLAQNITSAKYMIANVTGGIANVGTGMTNVMGEVFAGDYFDKGDFAKGQARYFNNVLSFMASMNKPTTNNLSVGIVKYFDVVDFDAFTERRPNEKATETVKRVRDSLYAMQSGGEHYMQNSVLFALLKSHRIFKDVDGQTRLGSINNYNWKVETETMMGLLNGKEDRLIRYKGFIKDIKTDLNELRKYDSFSKDLNQQFLRDIGDKNLIKEYIVARDKALSTAKEEFEKNPVAEDQFELVDGMVQVKENSVMTDAMVGEFRTKVISVNKKIHGVYDKIGAATIEKEWWGSLVMQYHKHIYPGIMKRYRTKAYYNESRGTVEKGSYISLANFLGTEFKGLGDRAKANSETDNENIALASIKELIKASVDTVINFNLNYKLMPVWEQRNMRRALGDLLGVTGAFLTAISIHLMTDDDEIKESELLATALYMADRINSESQSYTPWGMFGDAKKLWSSPIAAQNGPKDLIKGLSIGASIMFDDDFNPVYTTGLYKGENKLAILAYRNTPIYRVVQRLSTMTKNNNYYKINENALNIKFAKSIANEVNPD